MGFFLFIGIQVIQNLCVIDKSKEAHAFSLLIYEFPLGALVGKKIRKMKKKIFSAILVSVTVLSYSQIINEQVDFDHYNSVIDNDLVNNFEHSPYSTNVFIQLNSNGITGGGILPPNYLSWGNDYVKYCSTYKNIQDSLIETTISFKYDSTLINPNRYERIAVIWLEGTNSNHDVGYYLNKNSLSITTYNYAQSVALNDLIDGHWYKMVTHYKKIGGIFGDQVFVKVEIFDTGIDGKMNPISVGVHEANIYDIELANSDYFTIKLAGARWGGASYLDNFSFRGEKHHNICNSLSTSELYKKGENNIAFPNPAHSEINIPLNSNRNGVLKVYNSNGQLIENRSIHSQGAYYKLSINNYQTGMYFYEYNGNKGKFIVK